MTRPIDFTCHKCGAETPIAPDPPARAVCPDCCEDHRYEYDPWRRGKFCVDCDAPVPDDYYDNDFFE